VPSTTDEADAKDVFEFAYNDPDSSIHRSITVDAAGRHLIEEHEPWAATGSIVRSGIDMVPTNGALDGNDRFVESVTTVVDGILRTTVTQAGDATALLVTELDPATGITQTKINGTEETITRTPTFLVRPPLLHPTLAFEIVSTKGWQKTVNLNQLGHADFTNIEGTGIRSTQIDPVFRADGSLGSLTLTDGGAVSSISIGPNGLLTGLTDPLLDDIFGGHTYDDGKQSLEINDTTIEISLDGTTRKTSGADIVGQTRSVSVVGGGFSETIQPGTAADPTGSPTTRKHNASGAKTIHDYDDEADIITAWLAGGLLDTQSIARGGDISFGYSSDGAKNLTGIQWPTFTSASFGQISATPLDLTYDRGNRLKTVVDASGSRTLDYDRNRLWKTDYTSGPLDAYHVERHHDASGRNDLVTLKRNDQTIHSFSIGYTDDSDEISGLSSGGFSATVHRNDACYVNKITRGTLDQTWTRGTAGRITAAGSTISGAPSFAYTAFDTKGRRKDCTTSGATWDYDYGSAGQLTDATHTSLGSFHYTFDAIGRRDDNTGSPLNQYLAQTHDQTKTLFVAAHLDAHVRVWINGIEKTPFTGLATFPITLTPPSDAGGWVPWHTLAVLDDEGEGTDGANLIYNPSANPHAESEQAGAVWVPPIDEDFSYDADGNRESSALWNYGWDGRNKLVRARTKNHGSAAQGYDITFDYDSEGRRFKKNITRYRNGSIVSENHITFVWDEWDLIYERHQLPSGLTTLERKYVWGPDIADGNAGGAGGLYLIRETRGTTTTDLYPLYDGTGHVIGLSTKIEGVDTLVAEYAYGPFGERIKATGPMAQSNPFRYATKYFDTETGFYDFGLRYYDPGTGQWLNREPLGEDESLNLYAYCHNDPVNNVDVRGMAQHAIGGTLQNGVPLMIYQDWAGTGLGFAWNAFAGNKRKTWKQSPTSEQLAVNFYQENGQWHLRSESGRHNAAVDLALPAIAAKMEEIKPAMDFYEKGTALIASAPLAVAGGAELWAARSAIYAWGYATTMTAAYTVGTNPLAYSAASGAITTGVLLLDGESPGDAIAAGVLDGGMTRISAGPIKLPRLDPSSWRMPYLNPANYEFPVGQVNMVAPFPKYVGPSKLAENWVKLVRAPGSFDTPKSVGSVNEALMIARQALPGAVELPQAFAGQPYPSPPQGVKKWFQIHPAEPGTNELPHVKYADWTTGKKKGGGSWGHIFFDE
jgi:RHS repeat-associated protein